MEDHKVLIISDSRGAGLQEAIDSQPSSNNIIWTVKYLPGANLNTISRRLTRIHKQYDVIIVIAGICNFTTKVRRSTRNSIKYPTRQKDNTIAEIETLLDRFAEKIHICTITPADLLKRQDPNSTATEEDQINLVQDIEDTNRHIIERNISRDFPTIDIARNSYSTSLKQQGPKKKRTSKFNSKDLPDGIHPNEKLKQDWARYITEKTPSIITKLTEKQQEQEDESTDSDSDNTWNFKRK